MNYPVILYGSIPSLAPKTIAGVPDERALQNRTDSTVRVKEIRFRIEPLSVTMNNPGDIAVQIRIGNTPITEGFVQLVAMVWPADASAGREDGLTPVADKLPFLLRLSRPVLLAPGERIMVQAQHLDLGMTSPTAAVATLISVTAICEPVTRGTKGFTPWLAAYRTPIHLDGSGVYEDSSTEADLVNPFDDSMFIERIIGRVIVGDYANGEHIAFGGSNDRNLLFDAIRLRMDDHQSGQIIRDATPIGVALEFVTRSWVVNSMIAAKGFYRVTVQSKLSPAVLTNIFGPKIYTAIGMLGYREAR